MSVFLFEHIAMIESMVERFKTCVEQAYIHNETFVHLMMEGTDNLKQVFFILFRIIIISENYFIYFFEINYCVHKLDIYYLEFFLVGLGFVLRSKTDNTNLAWTYH